MRRRMIGRRRRRGFNVGRVPVLNNPPTWKWRRMCTRRHPIGSRANVSSTAVLASCVLS